MTVDYDLSMLYQYHTAEREQERDDYNSKITQLENLLKDKDRKEEMTQRLRTEVRQSAFIAIAGHSWHYVSNDFAVLRCIHNIIFVIQPSFIFHMLFSGTSVSVS